MNATQSVEQTIIEGHAAKEPESGTYRSVPMPAPTPATALPKRIDVLDLALEQLENARRAVDELAAHREAGDLRDVAWAYFGAGRALHEVREGIESAVDLEGRLNRVCERLIERADAENGEASSRLTWAATVIMCAMGKEPEDALNMILSGE